MRYNDTEVLQRSSQLAGRPALGVWYRLVGHAAVAGGVLVVLSDDATGVWTLFAVVLLLLFCAWCQEVGALHRGPLLAALLVLALGASRLHLMGVGS